MTTHHHQISHHRPNNVLNVIAVVSNPVRYKARYELFKKFVSYMETQNVNLIIVEMAFGNRDFECTVPDNLNHVQVRGNTELWVKENLINLGFQRLPVDWEYAAWIDADITFLNKDWIHDTLNALQHHKVVQLFQDCIDTGPAGQVLQIHKAFAYQHSIGAPRGTDYSFWHPGFAWAIRRDAFNGIGRLVDFAILGSADHHMALAFIGDVAKSIPGKMHQSYKNRLMAFEERCERHIKKDIGYIPGIIMHHWHGKKKDRRYVERWSVLVDNKYNPDTDIKYNSHGLLELDDKNHQLRDDIRRYMRSRHEDSVDLE